MRISDWSSDVCSSDLLQSAPELQASPTARPRSQITGDRMEKIEWGPHWAEILGGEFAKRSKDYNFECIEKEIYGQFENTFMMYLPRLCEHRSEERRVGNEWVRPVSSRCSAKPAQTTKV